MTGKKHRYPILNGSATLTLNGKKFSLLFEDKCVTIEGNDSDIECAIPKLNVRFAELGAVRRSSRMISDLGITIKLEDSKGVFLTVGKEAWSPLGHFSFKPRIRKYLKSD